MADPYDYVSPNIEQVDPSSAFPNRAVGAPRWAVFGNGRERNDPHRWYYDDRWPPDGFVNCDEAHLLTANARLVAGNNALEIGCISGYSAWHLLSGGVNLTICDPALTEPTRRSAVRDSLRQLLNWRLLAIPSPAGAIELGEQYGPWSLVFIDGCHYDPYPMLDAIAAQHFCAPDAMILFHDSLYAGVHYAISLLKSADWRAKTYYTSQMLAVCWRGNIEPAAHIPDPAIVNAELDPEYPQDLLRWD